MFLYRSNREGCSRLHSLPSHGVPVEHEVRHKFMEFLWKLQHH
jgi:hypothetical protein